MHRSGTDLFYEVLGEAAGPAPLLFMHGPGFDHTFFRPFLDPISNITRVIYFDSRGNGSSVRPESLDGVSIDTLIEDIDGLRSYLGIDRIIIHGHSFAGPLALYYAQKFGARVAGMILDCTFPVFDFQPTMMKNLESRPTPDRQADLMKAFAGQLKTDAEMRAG